MRRRVVAAPSAFTFIGSRHGGKGPGDQVATTKHQPKLATKGQTGDTVSYGFKLNWRMITRVRQLLVNEGLIDVHVVPV
jgi:hypothetical protein